MSVGTEPTAVAEAMSQLRNGATVAAVMEWHGWSRERVLELAGRQGMVIDGTSDTIVGARQAVANLRPLHTPSEQVRSRIANTTELLVRADGIGNKRIQGALGRARKALTDLAGLVKAWDEQASVRAEKEREREAARAEVERLTAQLREARAKLKGGARSSARSSAGTSSVAESNRRSTFETVNCSKCGKPCRGRAGLHAHERNCSGGAE